MYARRHLLIFEGCRIHSTRKKRKKIYYLIIIDCPIVRGISFKFVALILGLITKYCERFF